MFTLPDNETKKSYFQPLSKIFLFRTGIQKNSETKTHGSQKGKVFDETGSWGNFAISMNITGSCTESQKLTDIYIKL